MQVQTVSSINRTACRCIQSPVDPTETAKVRELREYSGVGAHFGFLQKRHEVEAMEQGKTGIKVNETGQLTSLSGLISHQSRSLWMALTRTLPWRPATWLGWTHSGREFYHNDFE